MAVLQVAGSMAQAIGRTEAAEDLRSYARMAGAGGRGTEGRKAGATERRLFVGEVRARPRGARIPGGPRSVHERRLQIARRTTSRTDSRASGPLKGVDERHVRLSRDP